MRNAARPPAAWVAVDGVLALATTVTAIATLRGLTDVDASALAYAAVIVHTGALAVRHLFPLAVLATMVVAAVVMAAIGVPVFVAGPVVLLAVYSVAAAKVPAVSLPALAAVIIGLAVQGLDFGGTVTWGLITTGSWALGNYVRTRRVYTAELEQRAAELQRAREELAEQAVAAERLRIARELHDVVAHTMSVIAVQSGMGAYVIDTQPDEAKKALAAIEIASRGGLAELRRLLGVLRDGDDPAGSAASLAPAPGLADLERLAADTARAGVQVELSVEGPPRPLSVGLDLAAYRIIQEALTNVVKHAGTARARVIVRYGEGGVAVEVLDEGRGPVATANGSAGHGIPGMRERAAIYGGTVEAGARPGGGFRVTARLPTADEAPR